MWTIDRDYPDGSHWDINNFLYADADESELTFEEKVYKEAFDLLVEEVESDPCFICHSAYTIRCGGLTPNCNGTEVQDV